jgi:hypothetical protein
MRWKTNLLIVAIFLLGMVAGFGVGDVYGNHSYNAKLEQQVIDLTNRYQTVNDNFVTLAANYNKLFTLRAPVAESVSAAPSSTTPVAPKPTVAPTTVKPSPTTAAGTKPTVAPTTQATAAPAGSGTKPKSAFKALALSGDGSLQGNPPLEVSFTDLSTGTITSWKWEFGDGATSTERNPKHMFESCPGGKNLCTVKLTVCGAGGCDTKTEPDYIYLEIGCEGC